MCGLQAGGNLPQTAQQRGAEAGLWLPQVLTCIIRAPEPGPDGRLWEWRAELNGPVGFSLTSRRR